MFPNIWKKAPVLPLFKKGNPSKTSNYRSLLSCISKILERIVYKQIHKNLCDNYHLNDYQSGFQLGFSTVIHIIELYHKPVPNLNNGSETKIIFLDISEVFDRVFHDRVHWRLKRYGITGNVLKVVRLFIR